jgi:hypothetical protein
VVVRRRGDGQRNGRRGPDAFERRDCAGEPRFNVKFYVSNLAGDHAGVAMYEDPAAAIAVCDANGARLEPLEGLLPRSRWQPA